MTPAGGAYLSRIFPVTLLVGTGAGPVAVALTDGYHLAFRIAFGLVITAIAVAATVLRPAQVPAAPQDTEQPMPELARATSAAALADDGLFECLRRPGWGPARARGGCRRIVRVADSERMVPSASACAIWGWEASGECRRRAARSPPSWS